MRKAELVRSIPIAEVKLALGVPADNDLVIDDVGALGVTFVRLVQVRQLRYVDTPAAAGPGKTLKMPGKTRLNARRRRGRK